MKAKTDKNLKTNSENDSVAETREERIDAIEEDVVSDINEEFKNSETSLEVEEKKSVKKNNVKEDKTDEPSKEGEAEVKEEKSNVFSDLTQSMRDKRSSLLSKIDEIKSLREKLKNLNRTGVRSLERKKDKLEFRISTEAITLDRERALMKEIKGLNDEIKAASASSDNRRDVVGRIKELDGQIEILKNELDEMKLTLINLREERKKRKQMIKKKKEAREARVARGERGDRPRRRPEGRAPTEEELFVSLEDIVVINKK